jgi:hypothetical protein
MIKTINAALRVAMVLRINIHFVSKPIKNPIIIQIATIESAITKVIGLPAILADHVKNFKRVGVLCFI